MMRQHRELKRQAGEALLFFRMGDFYELFEADAEKAAPLLDLVLTSREKDTATAVPMCGVPFHALEGYVRRCLAAGLSVAIAEQTEDPRAAKGLVRREIVEIVTPGLVANADRLEGASANYLAAVIADGGLHGLAYLDLSTGEFAATECERREIYEAELDRIAPRELVAREVEKDLPAGIAARRAPDLDFDPRAVEARVGRLPHGLTRTRRAPRRARRCGAVRDRGEAPARLARAARRAAPLPRVGVPDARPRDATTSRAVRERARRRPRGHAGRGARRDAFAARTSPAVDLARRAAARSTGDPCASGQVAAWLEPDSVRESLRASLRTVGDLERALSRATLATGGPRELAQLRASVCAASRAWSRSRRSPMRCATCAKSSRRSLVDDPPQAPRGEPHVGYVRDGVDPELDEIRRASLEGEAFFVELEARERARTGIPDAQGPLQPRVRLVDRGDQGAPRAGPGGVPAQADHGRRASATRRTSSSAGRA